MAGDNWRVDYRDPCQDICLIADDGRLAVGDMILLSLNEPEQLGVDLILMRRGDAVRRAWEVDVLRLLD